MPSNWQPPSAVESPPLSSTPSEFPSQEELRRRFEESKSIGGKEPPKPPSTFDDEEEEPRKDPVGWTEALGEHAANPPTPRTTGETIYALPCPDCGGERCDACDHTGLRRWTMAPVENRIKAQFEQDIRRAAKKAITVAEQDDGPEEGNRLRSIYLADVAAGCYTWDGRYCRNALSDFHGFKLLFLLCLRRCQPDVTEDEVREIILNHSDECKAALTWALGNSRAPRKAKKPEGRAVGETTEEGLAILKQRIEKALAAMEAMGAMTALNAVRSR